MAETRMGDLVVGLDGSAESTAALVWAASQLAPGGRLHAVHVLKPAAELALDAVLGDSVLVRHRREVDLEESWLRPVRGRPIEVHGSVREGSVADELLAVADEVDAAAVVVGHHPHTHFGPRIVGHVTAELIHRASRPIVVVPERWNAEVASDLPVVVGVGVAKGTRSAIRWAVEHAPWSPGGLSLVHAIGPRSMFRPDGVLDVLGYHLDPSVVSDWVEDDLLELASDIRDRAGVDVELSVDVVRGRIGARLVEAGHRAQLLVIGRGEPAFIRRHVMAPYLRHVLVDAPCPIAVVPIGGAAPAS